MPSRSPPFDSSAPNSYAISLGIGFDGRSYRYKDFRYDRLADAINYAQQATDEGETQQYHPWVAPKQLTVEEQDLMNAHKISFDGIRYHLFGFKYDHLTDAVNQALRIS